MRIVISGYYGFENIGDEAILFAIIRSVKEYDPQVELVVLSNDPQYTKEKHGVDAVNRWNVGQVAKAVKGADFMISGGGSLFQDQTSNKNIWYYAAVIRLARWFKKPVLVYAQGIGPVKHKKNQRLLKKLFQSVQIITVRDEHSRQALESYGVSQPIQIVPDPVLGIDPAGLQSEWLAGKQIAQKKLAVSIRSWSHDQAYLKKVADALDELAAEGYAIVLVPMHGSYDEKTSKQLQKLMHRDAHIAPSHCSINEKMAIIKESDVLLGMRLHALIFAAIGNTPFLALSYDPKIDAFTSIVEQTFIGHVNDAGWTAADIVAAVERIMDDRTAEQGRLQERVTPLKERSTHIMHELLDSLTNKQK